LYAESPYAGGPVVQDYLQNGEISVPELTSFVSFVGRSSGTRLACGISVSNPR